MAEREDHDASDELGAPAEVANEAHQAVAVVSANLNRLVIAIEQLDAPEADREALLQFVNRALDGADQATEQVRRLKQIHWQEPAVPDDDPDADTWDDDGTPARVLVVDDDSRVLAAMCRDLRRYVVILAEDDAAARDLLSNEYQYDLIIYDLQLPGFNGVQAFEHLTRHRPDLCDKLVFTSDGSFTKELRTFLGRTNNSVLQKPLDTKTLRWLTAQKLRG